MLPKCPKHWHCSPSHMLLGSLLLCSAVNKSPAALLEPHQLVKQENPTAPLGTGPGCTHRCHSDTFYNLTDSLPMSTCSATVKRAGTGSFLCNEGCPGTQYTTSDHCSALKPYRGTVQHTNSKFQYGYRTYNLVFYNEVFLKRSNSRERKKVKKQACVMWLFFPYFSPYSSDCKPCLCGRKQLLVSHLEKNLTSTQNASEEDFRQHQES